MSSFETGTEVYLETGQAVEYLALVHDGHVVRPIYETENEEPHWGKPQTVQKVFKTPPLEKYHEATVAATASLAALRLEIKAAQDEWHAFLADEKARRERLNRHAELRIVDDFLADRITHVVIEGDRSIYPPSLLKFEDSYLKNNGEEKEKDFKLITLFGRSGGKLDWRINRYYDGSGSWTTVYPFTSLEDARAKVEKIWDHRMDEFRLQTGYMHGFNYWVDAAEKRGRPIPADLARRWFERELENARDYVIKGEEEVEARKARVSVLEDRVKGRAPLQVVDTKDGE